MQEHRLYLKEQQRAAIKILRMIGSSKIEALLDYKDLLYQNSIKFAKQERPDFMIMKEGLLAYEKIIISQIKDKEGARKSGGK